MVGMAGIASALLGAPISTILIVFELTANYGTLIAEMLCSSLASTIMQLSPNRSFFSLAIGAKGRGFKPGPRPELAEDQHDLTIDPYQLLSICRPAQPIKC